MSPPVDLVHSDAGVPTRTGVVVIGGGIVGVTTALFLAEKGHAVVLCEKGRIGGEQSSRNWGWCRTAGRDLAEVPLAALAVRMWEAWGTEVGFHRAGSVLLCETARDVARHAKWLETARDYQLSSRLLDANETARLLPETGRRWAGALYTPADGRAEPSRAVPALADRARRLGVSIVEGCAARGLDLHAGRVRGVVTERGTIQCDAAVLAGGAWSRLFCGNAGMDFPQLAVLGSVLRTAPLAGPDLSVGGARFAFRRRDDGGYTIAQRNATETLITPESFRQFRRFAPALVKEWRELRVRFSPRAFATDWRTPRQWSLDEPSPFETTRILDPAPNPANLAQGRAALIRAFPGFARMQVTGTWGGMIDVTPDGVPVIDHIAALSGFYLASGFSGHGFGIAPAAGRLMADLVTNAIPVVDPAPFRLTRLLSLRAEASLANT